MRASTNCLRLVRRGERLDRDAVLRPVPLGGGDERAGRAKVGAGEVFELVAGAELFRDGRRA